MKCIKTPKVYYISQGNTPNEHLENIKKMVDAGVDWVQLRIKEGDKKEILSVASKAQKYCEEHGVVFIVNDDIEIAHFTHANGVHLGKEDESPEIARELLGKDKIVGGTANTWEDCQKLIDMKVDYIGLGPYRFTTTKKKLSPILGLEGYKQIIQKMRENHINIPIISIGGIELKDVEELQKIGISGIALSGFLHQEKEPKATVREIQSYFK
ncbi:thiamine phosphate synthase [Ornithobacterium rhinotracheale]|uniref:thiamine phosphate synthase n=1 Tax=Ornithobacterium rhinotracheale TaxID=28251 RepID=UPI0040372CC4